MPELDSNNRAVIIFIRFNIFKGRVPPPLLSEGNRSRSTLAPVDPIGTALENRQEAITPASIDGNGGVASEDEIRRLLVVSCGSGFREAECRGQKERCRGKLHDDE